MTFMPPEWECLRAASPRLELQDDLICFYLRCRSANLAQVQSNFRLLMVPINAASAAKPHSARSLPPSKRHTRLTIVRRGCWMCRNVGIHGEAMYTALTLRSACSYSSCKPAMSGVEGPSPRVLLGVKGGHSLT